MYIFSNVNNTKYNDVITNTVMDIIGLTGGFIIGLGLIPQIVKVIKTKSTKDLSYFWQILYMLGISMNIIYSIYFNLWSIYIPASLEFTCVFIIFNYKLCIEKCCVITVGDEVVKQSHQ